MIKITFLKVISHSLRVYFFIVKTLVTNGEPKRKQPCGGGEGRIQKQFNKTSLFKQNHYTHNLTQLKGRGDRTPEPSSKYSRVGVKEPQGLRVNGLNKFKMYENNQDKQGHCSLQWVDIGLLGSYRYIF